MLDYARKVIVADDTITNQLVIEHVLRSGGYNPLMFSSGDAVLDELSREPGADAIVLDARMPEMTGAETIKLIRFSELGQGRRTRIPIVAVTADDREEAKIECLSAGADAFLAQPILSGDLISTISGLIAEREAARTSPPNDVTLLASHPAFRASSENAVNRQVIADLHALAGAPFLEELAESIRIDTEVALNYMRSAIETNDLPGFKDQIMNLVSASVNLGASNIKPINEYAKSLQASHFGIVGPIVIERLKYEVGVLADVLERFEPDRPSS